MMIQLDGDEMTRILYWHYVASQNVRLTQADKEIFEKFSKSLDEDIKAKKKRDAQNDYDW